MRWNRFNRKDKIIMKENEMCPCCSGKLYVNCCKDYIEYKREDLFKALDSFEYIKAYNIAIAKMTEYLSSVIAHTIPLLREKKPFGRSLLDLDMKALEEIIYDIFSVIRKRQIPDNLEERFWAISGMVPNAGWKDLFQFFALLYCDLCQKENTYEYIEQIEISDKLDVKLLQVIFSCMGLEYGIAKKTEVLNLIISKCETSFERMHYKFSMAIEYFIVNDTDGSKKYADEVINEMEKYSIDIQNVYEMVKASEMYAIYGGLFDKREYYSKALNTYNMCLDNAKLNDSALAEIYGNMAYIYLKQQSYQDATAYFNKSLALEENSFSRIYLAEISLFLNDYEKAGEILDKISLCDIGNELLDYYIVRAEYFIVTGSQEGVKQFIEELQQLNIKKAPLFNDVIGKLMVELEKGVVDKKGIWSIISNIRKYLILQPNIGGIGINFDKVIDDVKK